MRRSRTLVGGVLFWVSCAAGPTVLSVEPVQEFMLEVGLSAVVSGTGLRVGFERVVSDSRCPADATCITAGEAVVAFTVARDGRPADAVTLHKGRAAGR